MAQVEMIMPRMGESVHEATIIKWLKSVGDRVELDEPVLEIATDKVDSEIPSPNEGVITKLLFKEGDTVQVDTVIAVIDTEGGTASVPDIGSNVEQEVLENSPEPVEIQEATKPVTPVVTETVANEPVTVPKIAARSNSGKFYSPLVRSIAKQESITIEVLETIPGTGKNGRITKDDLLNYLKGNGKVETASLKEHEQQIAVKQPEPVPIEKQEIQSEQKPLAPVSGNTEIIEMDRMRKLIADHMVQSKKTSPHVTSFVETDVTGIVNWRNKVKEPFQKREGEKITYTPIFVEAVVKAIKEFPMINSSVDGDKIILKKDINIGMATALPNGNLIVPVLKNADRMNLMGLAKTVNELAARARNHQLQPDEIQGGTFTITNLGSFGNVMGTPIINQPQVAILGVGAIRKKPAVIETEDGDFIGIRHMMFLSMSYDHRIIDGVLGGSFLRRVADILEEFDINQEV